MTDDELDALVAAVCPASQEQIDGLGLHAPAADLMEAIVSVSEDVRPLAIPLDRPRARRPIRRRFLAAAAAAAAVLVGVLAMPGSDDGTAFAAELVAVAEDAPRILVDDDSWSVTAPTSSAPSTARSPSATGRTTWRSAGTQLAS